MPNIAVVMVVHDELNLARAVTSLTNCDTKPYQVYLIDNGTTDARASGIIADALTALALSGIDTTFRRNPKNLKVGHARAQIFHEIRANSAIDLVTCLDGDDELGAETLKAFVRTFKESSGEVDVIVPREIAYRYDSDQTRVVQHALAIPDILTAKPNATRQQVQAWVDLTRVGATFAIRVGALAQYNGFSRRHVDDEWVWMFTGWAKRRARFAYAEMSAVNSYQYWQHDMRVADPHYERRKAHNAVRRFNTARRALICL